MKNKTLAAWLSLLLGTLGAHHFYLRGWRSPWAWGQGVLTAVGIYGLFRLKHLGGNDALALPLTALLGLSVLLSCAASLVYGLSSGPSWQKFHGPAHGNAKDARNNANPTVADPEETIHPAAQTGWATILAVSLALLVGAIALLSSLIFVFQAYFESSL